MRTSRYLHHAGRILAGTATLLFLLLLLTVVRTPPAAGAPGQDSGIDNNWPGAKAKYVFMFIGDGLGLQQISAAEAYQGAMRTRAPGLVKLSFSGFAGQGLCTTYSANSFITDSAPAATALASGYKTDNGVIGLDPSKQTRFPTIAEAAKSRGMRVGVVSSVSLNHATPASYYAHIPSRGSYYEIGLQMLDSGFDYFAGGGLYQATDKGRTSLYEIAAQKGFRVLRERGAIMAAKGSGSPMLAVNANLDADSAMPYVLDSGSSDVSLAEFTQKGIELLDNPQGFFLMVEGGKIDWACHANDAASSIVDTLEFDRAVRVASAFARQHPEETLIVVAGDHETGGMSLGFAGTEYSSFFDKLAGQKASFSAFDKTIDQLRSSKGKSATLADIQKRISENFGLLFPADAELESLKLAAKSDPAAKARLGLAVNATEREQLAEALALSMAGGKISAPSDSREFLLYGGYEPLSIQITHILNNKAGIGWTSYAHTGIPVPVFADGVGSEIFRGYYDNTDVAWKIYSIMGITPERPTAAQAVPSGQGGQAAHVARSAR